MTRQIIYLISGPGHIPYLLASIWSLRKTGYKDDVIVYTWPESTGYVRCLERDDRLGVWVSEREPKYRRKDGFGRNSQGLDRIDPARSLDCDLCLYLDADTTIHGDLTPLFDEAERKGYCATQWCDWFTNEKPTNGRIESMGVYEEIPSEYIKKIVSSKWPSLNCGVFACSPRSKLLDYWYDWTKACKSLFISDEKAQHLLMVNHLSQMSVLMGGAFNCSPKHQPKNLRDDQVVVRHYHGHSNVRPQKTQKGFDLWQPIWRECLELNLGKVNSWWKSVGNKWMNNACEGQMV